MGLRFRTIAAPNIGLLLPASVPGDLAFIGIQLAGKLPVVLNWTTGPANLAHAARLMGLRHVVTSKLFVDRLGVQVEGAEYVYLEDYRKKIGKIEQLRGLLRVRLLPGAIRARVPKADPDS